MALIPLVGRKSWKIRFLIGMLYLALSLGAATMVYPFLIMVGASITSQYDQSHYDIIPGYLRSSQALFGKYAEDKFGGDIGRINGVYGTSFAKLDDVVPPETVDQGRVRDWYGFLHGLPPRYRSVGFIDWVTPYTPSPLLDRYRAYLQQRFHGDIRAMDRAYTQEDDSFLTVFPPFEQPSKHNSLPDQSAKGQDWKAFQAALPAHFFIVVGSDPIYQKWLKEEQYASLDDFNQAWGTAYKSFGEVVLPSRPAGNAKARQDWEIFVRTKLPIRFVHADTACVSAYRAFLQSRYHGKIGAYNAAYGVRAGDFQGLSLPNIDTLAPSGPPLVDWIAFLKSAAPLRALTVDSVEIRYRVYAQARYHLASAAAAVLPIPAYAADWDYVRSHTVSLRTNFVLRNYQLVLQYFLLHGRGVFNTVVFCLLAILTALIVNPFCAYALSRYNLPYSNAVLLFLLTTMAFPAEVAMIPNFLLLKELGFLNTFYALILPSAASGYSIFLLKGFFDSLPKELYEAGTLDGASEARMFWTITLPLSTPIFAVTALGAFTSAYGAFLFALLVCQSQKMWTLMVWLYELQSGSAPQFIMMAALTLTAIPTLIVFIFAQKTIMKGIILPSFT